MKKKIRRFCYRMIRVCRRRFAETGDQYWTNEVRKYREKIRELQSVRELGV